MTTGEYQNPDLESLSDTTAITKALGWRRS
jgi:hypothetical protein